MSDSTRNEIKEWIKSLVLAIGLALFLRVFVFTLTYVDGESMFPTLEDGDRLVLSKYKASFGLESFDRGDIIVFRAPAENRDYIKRIIATEGDRVNIEDGQVYVNGQLLDEYYIEDNIYTEPIFFGQGYTIPKGKIFVVGDNRHPKGSNDSRSFGAISTRAVKGKTKYRVYPHPTKLK